MMRLGSETLVVLTPTWVDDRGTQVADYANARASTVKWCSMQPVQSTEPVDGRQAVVSRYVARMPEGTRIASFSRVQHRGVAYDVDGEPQRWGAPIPHVKVSLVERRG